MPDEVLAAINKLTTEQARMGEQIKTLFNRQDEIKELTETVHKLALSIERQGLSLKTTDQKVDSLKTDVDEIKAKPAKRWDSVVTLIITTVGGALLGFLLARIGIK